jgi:hypothetical protein
MSDNNSSNQKSNRLHKIYNFLKFFSGGVVFLISCIGEYGSSTNISFSYMRSNPKFPTFKRPETILKFTELFVVSVSYSLMEIPLLILLII